MKNIYRLTNINTGEVREGDKKDLYEFEEDRLRAAATKNMLLQGMWKVEIARKEKDKALKDAKPSARKKKNEKEIDRIAIEAEEAGLTYGQYVAMTEMGGRFEKR